MLQSPSKPLVRRPSLLLPAFFSAQLRQPAHPIHPVKQLRDDQGHGREAAPPSPGPLVDGRGRLFVVPRRPWRGLVVFYTQSASSGSAWCRVEGNPCSGSEENAQTLSTDDSGGEALLTLLAVGSQAGCTREFFRDWANQDAAEAVFEKSRDPRWRLDAFSIEPPAMSRFASPYDPEFPPAPPDDPTSEALSPVPQWPDHRLIVPAEGTGYIDMMEGWMRERDAAIAKGEISLKGYTEPGNGGRNGIPQSFTRPKPPVTSSPFAPGTGSPSSPPANAGGPGSPTRRAGIVRRRRRPRGERRRPRQPSRGQRPERRRGILAGIPGQTPKVRRQYS